MNVLRDLGLIAGELLRDLACAMLCAALVLYVIALYSGGVFQTTLSHAEACPNATLRTGPSAALPDCRAYEQVSPVEKNGGYINQGSFVSSPEGESVGFTSNSGFAGATSDLYTSTGYQAARVASSGWGTVAETQSEAQFIDRHALLTPDYRDVSFGNVETLRDGDAGLEGGARVWLLQEASQPESDLSFYVTRADGPLVRVGPAVPPTTSGLNHATGEEINVLGMSADASHVVFEDTEPKGLNQWSFGMSGALLEYPNTGTTESEPEAVVPDPATEDNNCPRQLLGGKDPQIGFDGITNPISTDGSRIFFTDGGNELECQGQGELFARVDSGEEDARTVAISEPTKEDCSACEIFESIPGKPEFSERSAAEFVGASEDGSKVFFNTGQSLLDGEGGLYEYNFDAPEGQRVSLVAPGGVAVQHVSEDASHVYFTSTSVLTEEPSIDVRGRDKLGHSVESGAVAQPGELNLYVFEQDSRYPTGHVGFIATLQADDENGGRMGSLTPDGRFLVFTSRAQLTADDSSTAAQVFEYDALTGAMVRVSVGQDGYNNNGNSYLSYPGGLYAESVAGSRQLNDSNNASIVTKNGSTETAFGPSSYSDHLSVSADGSHVFFTSPIGLTPQALNRVLVGVDFLGLPVAAFAENVYEWHAGEVSLISDGKDTSTHDGGSQVHLLSTDLSGRDVFFETVDSLVSQDTDSNKDIYDARIEGGFPAPVQPVSCSGDACQGQLSGSPVLLSPGSEFQAGGNPTPAALTPAPVVKTKPKAKPKAKKCKTGAVLRHGKCVKRKAKKSTRRGSNVL